MNLKEFCLLAIDKATAVLAGFDNTAALDKFSLQHQFYHKATLSRIFDAYYAKQKIINDIVLAYAKFANINITVQAIYEIDDDYVIASYNDLFITYNKSTNNIIAECSNTLHEQILVTLGYANLGANQNFAKFASKMLEINDSKKSKNV